MTLMKAKFTFALVCISVLASAQEWKQIEIRDDSDKLTGEKKWFYKVEGKFRDYDTGFGQTEFKIKPLNVSAHIWEDGTINFYFDENNDRNPSTFLTEEKSNPIKKKNYWILNVMTQKRGPITKFTMQGCFGAKNCLMFAFPSQREKFITILKAGQMVCQIEHEKRQYIWPISRLKGAELLSDQTTYNVGDIVPELGGIVFYVDSSGKHGLVAAEMDQGAFPWGCIDDVITGANREGLFEGEKNTRDIIARCREERTSPLMCSNLALNGFKDWYLPSKDELNLMYLNLHKKGLGNFKNVWYHSSTQNEQKSYFSANAAWHQKFDDEGTQLPAGKKIPAQVRAIRSF
jgi:hypothetical protein